MKSRRAEERQTIGDAFTLLHLHIPKTAGTTFQEVLSQVYDSETRCSVYPNWPDAKERIQSLDWRGRVRVMSGHFAYGLHDDPEARLLMEDEVRYSTFVREPVARVVSNYNYLVNSDYPGHQEIVAEHPTLESFLDHKWARDMQVCFLTNWDRQTIKDDKPAAVRAANALLRDRFDAVGLTERFDESLILFAEAFGWDLPTYTTRNRSSDHVRRLHVEDLSRSLVDRIKNFNQCDLPIYEYACSLFEERCAEVPSFQEKLTQYRSRLANGESDAGNSDLRCDVLESSLSS